MRQLVLDKVKAFADIREVQPKLAVLLVVPARPDPDLDPTPLISSTVVTTFANTPGWRNVTGETSAPSPMRSVSRARPPRTAQASVVGCPRSREALEMVGSEERLEAVGLGAAGDRELVEVAHALLGLGHQDEAHGPSTGSATIL